MKNIAVLGITGSIGKSTTAVVNQHPDKFHIMLASAHKSSRQLLRLAEEYNIDHIVLTGLTEIDHTDLPVNCQLHFGERALLDLIKELPLDVVLNAITGSAGLLSSIYTIESGIDLALANKESLVLAGHLIKKLTKTSKSKILPVDSEHSAIFQCLEGHKSQEVKKIILTASGGAFRDLPLNEFTNIHPENALKHPTWSMGTKVTIDSATMLNKGLEVIEAHWLFDVEYQRIEAIIHPQSIIHSLVEFLDGSILAQLCNPTMKLPILYAMTYPKHIKSDIVKNSILDLPQLNFRKIDPDRYPLYYLARECAKVGGIMPTVMNAANEAALDLFLENKISFLQIHKLIDATCQAETNINDPDLDTIIKTNQEVFRKCYTNYKSFI